MAVLIFKQGNSESSSLAYAEPLFHTDSNTIILSGSVSNYVNTEVSPNIDSGSLYRLALTDYPNTGSMIVTGDFSGSNLLLDGNATIRGNITMGGSGLDFGDSNTDNIVFKADISSSILPNDDNSFDLGSSSQRWASAYLADLDISGSFRVDGGPIDLHSDTYISASSGTFTKLNVGTFLDVDADGAIDIDSDTQINIGTNVDRPINIDATTLDIDTSGDFTLDATNAKVAIIAGTTASFDGESAIHIGLEERVPLRVEGQPITINSSTNIDVDADGGKLTLDGSTGIDIGVETDVPIDVNSSTLDIDASGDITINGESSTSISSSGALNLDSETGINIGTTTDKPIDIDASTLAIDASGDVNIDSATAIRLGTANSGTTISIGHTTSETTVNDNLTVTGNLVVNGETTYVSSSNMTIGDRIIELNYLGASGNGGIYVGDADGTLTSGSLLWDSTNDYWIAGPKDSEQKILLANGDSMVSGSGVDNQVAIFNAVHGLDSDGNFTFDGSKVTITGTLDVTEDVSGSLSGSFNDLFVNNRIVSDTARLGLIDISGSVILAAGAAEVQFADNVNFSNRTLSDIEMITANSGSFNRVVGSIGATNGVVSSSAQITTLLPDGVVSGSSQITDGSGIVSGSDQLTSSYDERYEERASTTHTLLSGSLNAGTNVTINVESGNYFISSSGGGGGGVGTLQQVTDSGSVTTNAVTVGDGTDSTSKTTGALIVSGGLGVLTTIEAGGDVIAYASSDRRLKDNIQQIENPLEIVSQLSGNTFDWNEEKQHTYSGRDYGVIAQEIQAVMPELVDTRDNGYLAVKYDKIVPLLIESIKELKREIEELKSK